MTRRWWMKAARVVVIIILVIAVTLWSLDMVTETQTRARHKLVVLQRHEPAARDHESARTAERMYEFLRTVLRTAPVCVDDVLLVILITSAPDHVVQRAAIRRTWCAVSARTPFDGNHGGSDEIEGGIKNPSRQYQCVFLIGSSENDATERRVNAEVAAHGDIAKGSYVDSYRNLTSKVLAGFHWCAHQCRPKFVLKTDDDCFVNVAVLLRLLAVQTDDDLYVGKVFLSPADTLVIRSADSRWAVSQHEYAPVYYPPYASGTGYLLSYGAMRKLLAESRRVSAFPNEDAYVGVLADQAGIIPTNSYRFTFVSDKWAVCNYKYLVVIHHVIPHRQEEQLQMVRRTRTQCSRQKFLTSWD